MHYFGLFIFSSGKNSSHLTVLLFILLLFLKVPTTSSTFMVLWDDILYFLLIQVSALYYQPPCHKFFQLAIIFKLVAAKFLLSFFFPSLVWLLLLIHCRRRGLLLDLIILADTHTHTPTTHHTQVELLWTSDQLVAETSSWQHTTLTTDRHPCPQGVSNL
jgi:hypothetical protein